MVTAIWNHTIEDRYCDGYGRGRLIPVWIWSAVHDERRVVRFPFPMMSTRSFIARRTEDGYEGVYCHWDGYLECNGALLSEHYRDPDSVAELLSHGDMSVLGPSVGVRHDFDDRGTGFTTYYGRDRGETEPEVQTKRFRSLWQLMCFAEEVGCEYFYLFKDGQWEYASRGPQYFGMSDGTAFSTFTPLRIS